MLLIKKIFAVLLLFINTFASSNATSSEWELMHGSSSENKYRFIEQYGEHKNLLTEESSRKQRLDFTYSKNHGWMMYLTTHLLANENDSIILSIDSETYMFNGQGCCHKQAFPLNEKIINQLKSSKSLLIEEIYYAESSNPSPSFHYQSEFSTIGLSKALDWAKTQ